MADRHKVFVSYYHEDDQQYRERFENLFSDDILVSKSVEMGDIDPYLKTETIHQKIRDNYLRDSTVTVVLIGKRTWQRKFVDWEIGSSIRKTEYNRRSGLLGIVLPTYYSVHKTNNNYDPYTIPPRLYDNIKCGFAEIYYWNESHSVVKSWIHQAFLRKDKVNPDNSYPSFGKNRSGERWQQ